MRHRSLPAIAGLLLLCSALGCDGGKASSGSGAVSAAVPVGSQAPSATATAVPAAYAELLGPPSGEPKLTTPGAISAAGVGLQAPANWGIEQDGLGGRTYARNESASVRVSPLVNQGFLKDLSGGKAFPEAGDMPFGPTPPKGREGFTRYEAAKIGDGTPAMVAKQNDGKEISYYALARHPKTAKVILFVGSYKVGAADKEKEVIEVMKSVTFR